MRRTNDLLSQIPHCEAVSRELRNNSKLKSQKELKKITDSKEYKKADYKKKTEMLGGKVYAKGGRVGFAHGSKRPKGGWTD